MVGRQLQRQQTSLARKGLKWVLIWAAVTFVVAPVVGRILDEQGK